MNCEMSKSKLNPVVSKIAKTINRRLLLICDVYCTLYTFQTSTWMYMEL